MKKTTLSIFLVLLILASVYSQSELIKFSGNPVMIPEDTWEGRVILPGSVIKVNDTLRMWYSGGDFPLVGGNFQIGMATSTDGMNWTRYDANPIFSKGETGAFDASGSYAPSIIYKDGIYHMWYSGYTTDKYFRDIGHATSEDGINWTRNAANPVLEENGSGRVHSPTVVYNGSQFHMWYSISTSSSSSIGHAVSDDGINWTRDAANPVINAPAGGESIYPHAYYDGVKYHIWYSTGKFLEWNLAYATSDDGYTMEGHGLILTKGKSGDWDEKYTSFTSLIVDTIGNKQQLKLLYTSSNAATTELGIGLAYLLEIPDLNFTKSTNNPVLETGNPGTWDDGLVAGLTTVFDGSMYHGWYAGYDGSTGTHIGYASSENGICWIKNGISVLHGQAGSWDQTVDFQPCVLYDGSTYHMWFTGHAGARTHGKIGYASSTDGINWTKYESNPVLTGNSGSWDGVGVNSPSVMIIDGLYHMWYSGNTSTVTSVGHATSEDGINWVKDTLNPVLTTTSKEWDYSNMTETTVLLDKNSVYHMFYTGGSYTQWDIGYAQSYDGRNWVKYDKNPVLENGSGTDWDRGFVGLATVAFNVDSSAFNIWYTGGIVDGTKWDIGYATTGEMPLDCDCGLSELSVDAGEMTPAFNADSTSYSIKLEEGTSSLTISATANFAGAKVTGDGIVDLSDVVPGDSKDAVVAVNVGNGTECDYTITITINEGTASVASKATDKVSIYPNPASQTVHVTNVPNATIYLFAVNGALLKSINAESVDQAIDVSKMDSGVYFLKIQLSENVKIFRFIKE